MNILFLFVSLPDNINDEGLFTSLISEFDKNGHEVSVSTRGRNIKKTKLSKDNGIDVLRIKCPEFTGVANKIKKALAYQEYIIKQTYYVKKYFKHKKFDVIISHSLPPELALEISVLKRYYNCKFYLLQTDYTWQDAVAYGYFSKNGPVGLYYRFWERWMFKLADFIGCPTKGNIDFISKEYPWVKQDVFRVFNFWSKPIAFEKSDSIKEQLGLKDKFIAIYGGSVGPAQKLEHLVHLAEACKDESNIIFLILGKGSQVEANRIIAEEKGLKNIIFLPFMNQNEYNQLLSSCNAGFIVLNEKHATPNFPSKTLSYFNFQIPILASIDYITDYGRFLDETKTGLWSYSGDVETFKKNLLEIYHNPELCEEIKRNQIEYFRRCMLPEHAYTAIIKHINEK